MTVGTGSGTASGSSASSTSASSGLQKGAAGRVGISMAGFVGAGVLGGLVAVL